MFIQVDQVVKQFAPRPGATGAGAAAALGGVSVAVAPGQMLALVGPSGSGKTTLLRCIAGLERPDAGVIRIGEQVMFDAAQGVNIPTEQRNLGLIFQSYALWPNMTVQQNVAYPLLRRKRPAAEVARRVADYLELVGCGLLAQRYPHELSGGQQQRIALARALVYEPAVVLFDEPLSNLDPMLREHLRAQIREIQRQVGFTGVYVTHDQSEAFFVGDEVVLLDAGQIAQAGSPDALYRAPASAKVAAFVGATNVVSATLAADGLSLTAPDLGQLLLDGPAHPLATGAPRPVQLRVRPEALALTAPDSGTGPSDAPVARVLERVPSGGMDEYVVVLASGTRWRVRVDMHLPRFAVAAPVVVVPRAADLLLYPEEGAAP